MANLYFMQEALNVRADSVTESLFKDAPGLFLKDTLPSAVDIQIYSPKKDCSLSEETSITTRKDCNTSLDDQSPTLMSSSQALSEDSTLKTLYDSPLKWEHHTATWSTDIEALFSKQRVGLELVSFGQEHSYARFKISRSTFAQLRESLGIFPAMHRNILRLGIRDFEVEVAPPRPSIRILMPAPHTTGLIDHELCYGLRYIQVNGRDDYKKWSLRQCVVYNKTQYEKCLSTWLFISMPDVLRDAINQYLDPCQDEAHQHPFDIHTVVLAATLAMWSPYVVDLTERVEKYKMKLILSMPQDGVPSRLSESDGLALKSLEDDVHDAILAVEATGDTVRRVEALFRSTHTLLMLKLTSDHNSMIEKFFVEARDDVEMILKRLHTLRSKLESTTKAVSSFLTLMNGRSLHGLGAQAHLDTRAVQALTIITILFLPVTVILNFFSAAFIDTSSGRMELLPEWWLFLAIGIPLTIMTLLVWRIWLRLQGKGLSAGQVWRWLGLLCSRGERNSVADLEKCG